MCVSDVCVPWTRSVHGGGVTGGSSRCGRGGVAAVSDGGGAVSGRGVLELVADLGGDEGVVVDLGELEEAALLVDGHVVLVALGEDEEGLVPEDDHAALVLDEGGEVVDDGVDDAVREGVLFVEEGAEEDRASGRSS